MTEFNDRRSSGSGAVCPGASASGMPGDRTRCKTCNRDGVLIKKNGTLAKHYVLGRRKP